MKHLSLQNHLLVANPSLEDSVFSGSVLLICEHNDKGALAVMLNRPTDIRMEDIYAQLSLNQTFDDAGPSNREQGNRESGNGELGNNELDNKDTFYISDEIPLSSEQFSSQYVYFGGPINSERGLVLHEKMGDWQYSINVNNYIELTTSQDILQALAQGHGPRRSVFVLGYSSWEPGQLEDEIRENSWLTIPLEYNAKTKDSYIKYNDFQTEFSLISDLIFSTPAELQWRKSLELLGISPERLSDEYGHA